MSLHDINQGVQKNKRRQRIGRGTGSGWGKTSQRGHKGARSRAGWSNRATFQGGQTPIVRHVPKRGFNNRWALTVSEVNIKALNDLFNDGDTVNIESLREKGLCKRRFDEVKILGDGELSKKLTVEAHRFSASAKEKIEKAGGTCNTVVRITTVAEKKESAKEAKS
ncbi:50S ribosomal protein L15 [Bremerella alba]|uniref:Large ribosomal subunit protein uL15 n=1 Tax=Bremerella alba TaxID=980252 RepID=A0A7V9A6L7_9BACT|nr:50S ribosomal protein L15 [Bremerella alba]MBA2114442.1 50S ribosomal protein L15 [Bremerella alba]